MAPLTQNGSSFGSQQDPNAILNECREISRGVDDIGKKLDELKALQTRSINDPNSQITNKQLEDLTTAIMPMYRNLADRIKAIKQQPESGSPKNAPQLGQVDRKLKAAIRQYQSIDIAFNKRQKEQMGRQYKIVNPDATEAEIQRVTEEPNQQVFSQALLQSSRRGQADSTLNAVKSRHAEIQKVERQLIELAELFTEMDQLVVQQEAAVVNIEMKGEEVVENMDKGTQEIGTAIKSARNARKWKWWCLGICGMFYSSPNFPTLILTSTSPYCGYHRSRHPDLQVCHSKQRFLQQASLPSRTIRYAYRCSQSDLWSIQPTRPHVRTTTTYQIFCIGWDLYIYHEVALKMRSSVSISGVCFLCYHNSERQGGYG